MATQSDVERVKASPAQTAHNVSRRAFVHPLTTVRIGSWGVPESWRQMWGRGKRGFAYRGGNSPRLT